MSKRIFAQKIGAQGHKWLSSHIEEHPHWLSREVGEDYGIDLELELDEEDLRGDLLKVQVKTVKKAKTRNGCVKFQIDRKYLQYASTCRYPVLLILVCLNTKQAWYIWLQQWLLVQRSQKDPLSTNQKSWTEWVSINKTVEIGLSSELKSIAKWEGEVQLVLALLDTMRCASAIGKLDVVRAVGEIVNASAPYAGEAGLNALITQALKLGNRMKGTHEGNMIAQQIYGIIRHAGLIISKEIVINLVMRGDSYSRVGLDALGILYDEYFNHARSLQLPTVFKDLEPRVSYYCALREASPKKSLIMQPPEGFRYAGLKYLPPDDPLNKFANRGPSAILDYLVPENYEPNKANSHG
ncbi:protein of unknown function [Amphritea atlantica]|uniref:DUF4365 domain-containing protein n=1 Tax=Amphritea atlantica TaxID=355243 RepID=A0A1H9GQG6_9GAMM|nr:DUF4365 domain-containing protein [Amphritea atlantica]SEQ52283.1 protein of unknown function [Amphritea atlantica]